MQKFILIFSLIFSLAIAHTYAASNMMIVGGDSDSHGCKASAGYSWDAKKNQCTRPWEETSTGSVIVGGDRDVHGCIGSAGYVWDTAVRTCSRPWELKKITPKQLIQSGSWNYTTLDGIAISGTIQFNSDNTYNAKICNNINGSYRIAGGKSIILRSSISTMMYCDGGALMQAEQAMSFSRATFTLSGDTLTIKTPKHTFVLKR